MPKIEGKMLRKRKIKLKLLEDFIQFQNKMNKKKLFDKYNFLKLENYSQKEDGFFSKNFYNSFIESRKNLLRLKRKYNLEVVNDFIKLLNFVSKDKKKIIKDFVSMPFARQHHDFREDNILVNKNGQFLIDWGSSYGYGPFMYDYSKFLVNHKEAFNLVIKKSDMCKNIDRKKIDRWLYVSLIKKMLNMLQWYLQKDHHNIETKEKTKKMLDYEYKTYKNLLNFV